MKNSYYYSRNLNKKLIKNKIPKNKKVINVS